MKQPPCYQCDERSPVCHGNCERYAVFAAERQDIYRQRRLDNENGEAVRRGMFKKLKEKQRMKRR